MNIEIIHSTVYHYSNPIQLNPHYLHLKPLDRAYMALNSYSLDLSPHAFTISERFDAESNHYYQTTFESVKTQTLSITSKSDITISEFNPFEFIIEPVMIFQNNRIEYHPKLAPILSTYLNLPGEYQKELSPYVNQILEEADYNMLPFISSLNSRVHDAFTYERKEKGEELNAVNTFRQQTGSCKDLSWMMIHMLRCVGLAARFVSGYAYNPALGDGHDLHAWVEVFLQGAGWIGIDPSSGLFADHTYIPVAASFDPSLTMPVRGSFAGKGSSHLESTIVIEQK